MDDDTPMTPGEPVVLAPDSLEDPGALLVPDLDDDVPTVDDTEPDDAVVEHHAGTAA